MMATLLWPAFSALPLAADNVLSVSDIEGVVGKTVSVPVSLTNTDQVVSLQFDIKLPFPMPSGAKATLTDRSNGHVAGIRSLGDNRYTIVVATLENKPLRGNSGPLLSLPVAVSTNATAPAVYVMEVSNVVMGTKDVRQVPCNTRTGNLTVLASGKPDLIVEDVALDQHTLTPGAEAIFTWTVRNDGNETTGEGWNEQLFLVDAATAKEVFVATVNTSEVLADGASVHRRDTVSLPFVLGMDSEVRAKVVVQPTAATDEPVGYRDNNSALSSATYVLGKELALTLSTRNVVETSGNTVRAKLTRSGDWSTEETFALSTLGTGLITVPQSVTVPAGQSAANFVVKLVDNDLINADDYECITVVGNGGYAAVSDTLIIEDDELAEFTVTPSGDDLLEGGTMELTITAPRRPNEERTVYISCSLASRVSIPSSVVIPAGETTVTVTAEALDDDTPRLEETLVFSFTGAHYNKATVPVVLVDNDVPVLALDVTPTTVSEVAGPNAMMCTLRRLSNFNSKVTVKLTDDGQGDIYYHQTSVVLDKFVDEVQFPMGVIDNAKVDGERVVNVTAAVYISSCSCSAAGNSAGSVTVPITILDNDGPAIVLTSSKSMMLEGAEVGTVLTVSRNTNTSSPLTVTLSSDADDELIYEKTLTIPAGQTSASVNVKVQANDFSGDSHMVTFTAEANGFTKGSCWAMTTDQTLPDAEITAFTLTPETTIASTSVTATFTVANTGAAELPLRTPVRVYMNGGLYTTLYVMEALAAGASADLTTTLDMPARTGNYTIHAVVNEAQEMKELSYVNNTSARKSVAVTAPFTASVTVDKTLVSAGEAVTINGQLTGTFVENAQVEVYIINGGSRQTLAATCDASGAFTTSYTPYATQTGHFAVGACYPNTGVSTEMDSFDIYGMQRTSSAAPTHDVSVGDPVNGSITLRNPGVLPLTNIRVEILSQPETCEGLTFGSISQLSGGQSASISYTFRDNTVTEGGDWQTVKIRVLTDQGPTFDMGVFYYCRSLKGNLVADISRLNTTMIKGQTRQYPFHISNTGRGETGKVTLALPSWMGCVTPTELPSMAPGDTATVILSLTPTADMQLNVPVTGSIGINCESGNGLSLGYSIEPVSTSTGTLVVDVCDEYTYYTAEAPHLEGAEVVVKHPTSGAVIASGKTDANGLFTVELTEGYYTLGVSADKHDSYRNNIVIDPGLTTHKSVNLSIEAINISWKVEETEVEDEYTIVTTVKYETNVPAPVVQMEIPSRVEANSLEVGESLVYYTMLTNKGLITALDVELLLPDDIDYLEFEPLLYKDETFDLAPQQSVTIPVKVTRVATAAKAPRLMAKGDIIEDIQNMSCHTFNGLRNYYLCGLDRKCQYYHFVLQIGNCNGKSTDFQYNPPSNNVETTHNGSNGSAFGVSTPSSSPGGGGGGGGSYLPSSSQSNPAPQTDEEGCDPNIACWAEKMSRMGVILIDKLANTPLGCIWDLLEVTWSFLPFNK